MEEASICHTALTSRTDSIKRANINRTLSGRRIAQAMTSRGNTVAITSATWISWEFCKRRGGGSHGVNRLGVDKKRGNDTYSSAVCSTSVIPISASTALRDREGISEAIILRALPESWLRRSGLAASR